MRALCTFSLSLVLELCVTEAQASRARVVLVASREGPESVAKRLSAELELAGFEVVTRDARGDARTALEVAAKETGAFAAILLVPVGDGARGPAVDVWVADRVTAKTSVRRIELTVDPGARSAESVLAVRAVELLEASMLEIEVRPPAEPPPPEARALVLAARGSETAKGFAPTVRAGVAGGTNGAGAWLGASGAFEIPLGRTWLGGVTVVGSLLPAEVEASGARAEVGELAAFARLGLGLTASRRFTVAPALLLGAGRTSARGEADPPLENREASAWSARAGASVVGSFALASRLRLFVELAAHLSAPEVRVRMRAEPVDALGRLGAFSTLGLAWGGSGE